MSAADWESELIRRWLSGDNLPAPVLHKPSLSKKQLEALETAYELGHYDVPRKATGGDVGEALDVSHQAISERLRRAHASLIEAMETGPEASMEVGKLGLEKRDGKVRIFSGGAYVGEMSPDEVIDAAIDQFDDPQIEAIRNA